MGSNLSDNSRKALSRKRPARKHTLGMLAAMACTAAAMAQDDGSLGSGDSTVWSLFRESFDLFTIVLIAGSLVAVAQITRVIMEVRESNIAPLATTERLSKVLRREADPDSVRSLLAEDETFVAKVLHAAMGQAAHGRTAMHDAAELEATQQAARWFRKIEILNVIGNLGPLVGLAGTVWGMVIAFNTLGASGGEAGPAQLSSGIAKALFHTLLGLVLAVPCLLTFGVYRGIIDRVCTRAMADAARLLERLPGSDTPGGPTSPAPTPPPPGPAVPDAGDLMERVAQDVAPAPSNPATGGKKTSKKTAKKAAKKTAKKAPKKAGPGQRGNGS